jgi:hypothetical protein
VGVEFTSSGCVSDAGVDPDAGIVTLVFACQSGFTEASMLLWTVTLMGSVVTEATASTLAVDVVDLSDSQPFPLPIPGEGTETIVTLLPIGVCGDLTGDGRVNIFDAVFGMKVIVNTNSLSATQEILGDVVRDGEVNIFDLIHILQFIVGTTDTFAGCGR